MVLSYWFTDLSLEVSYECALTGHRGCQPVIRYHQGIGPALRLDGERIREADGAGRIEFDEDSGERRRVEIRSADINVSRKAGYGDEDDHARSDGVVGSELHRDAGGR